MGIQHLHSHQIFSQEASLFCVYWLIRKLMRLEIAFIIYCVVLQGLAYCRGVMALLCISQSSPS
ncbi:hypothetical protein HanIR_Chr17g0878411 [Helianthus annuus]|nr:hypothetical protein HanIR_Chr17g0878411 [Helianthus annuus]